WNEWFDVTLSVPRRLAEKGGHFQSHFRQRLASQIECILNFGTLPETLPHQTSVVLDIDVIWRGMIAVSELSAKLEAVHAPHRELFESYLLDNSRNLFNIS